MLSRAPLLIHSPPRNASMSRLRHPKYYHPKRYTRCYTQYNLHHSPSSILAQQTAEHRSSRRRDEKHAPVDPHGSPALREGVDIRDGRYAHRPGSGRSEALQCTGDGECRERAGDGAEEGSGDEDGECTEIYGTSAVYDGFS